MEYNFSIFLLILRVKHFFTIGYDLKLLSIKVVGGTFFGHSVYDYYYCCYSLSGCNNTAIDH